MMGTALPKHKQIMGKQKTNKIRNRTHSRVEHNQQNKRNESN